MPTVLLAVLLAFTSLAGATNAPDPTSDQASDVVVVTCNIRYDNPGDGEDQWSKRRSFLVNELRASTPDILAMQEALHHQLEYVEAALEDFDRVGVGRDDGESKGEYAPILVRRDRFRVLDSGTFWLSDSPETPGSASWGNRIPRICTWARLEDANGRTLRVFNVHLDHQSGPSRQRASALIAARIALGDDPVVLLGDFNEAPDGAIVP
ncbi:MAG: endonuclease/exonuclease/phosphatase family protein, partial [Phycisphaerales bacterium]|nr:endonuclease/exonuclease/phosphatase family protein [Phycisphaerales bacterium]